MIWKNVLPRSMPEKRRRQARKIWPPSERPMRKRKNQFSLEDFKQEMEGCNGRISLRIPRSLHKKLKENAAMEGVSLNQYVLYKLAK